MVVIAGTSPVNYLVLIAAIDILPKLYGGVTIPLPGLEERRHLDAPHPVVEWANDLH
jgi:predicted nucleic acid-binding protein